MIPTVGQQDKFVAMVTAKAEVDLRLIDFQPVSEIRAPQHLISVPRFPAVGYHNYLDSLEPKAVLEVMDQVGVEKIVNITMQTGEAAHKIMKRFHETDRERFHTIVWMDWTGLERSDFVQLTKDRLEALAERAPVALSSGRISA